VMVDIGAEMTKPRSFALSSIFYESDVRASATRATLELEQETVKSSL